MHKLHEMLMWGEKGNNVLLVTGARIEFNW